MSSGKAAQLLRSLKPKAGTRRFSSIPSIRSVPGRFSTTGTPVRDTAMTSRSCVGENGCSFFSSNRLNRIHHLLHRPQPNFMVAEFCRLNEHRGDVSKTPTHLYVHLP